MTPATLALTETARTLRCLQLLASAHRDHADEPEVVEAVETAVAVITMKPDVPAAWEQAVEAETRWYGGQVDRPDTCGHSGPPCECALAEQDAAARDLARVLWQLVHDGEPCTTCLDVLTGEPYEVAARTRPQAPEHSPCCSSHRRSVCHGHYSRSHAVDIGPCCLSLAAVTS